MSLRKAINDKCKECLYDPYHTGGWRQQVEECTAPNCALFPVRPFSGVSRSRTANSAPQATNDHEKPSPPLWSQKTVKLAL